MKTFLIYATPIGLTLLVLALYKFNIWRTRRNLQWHFSFEHVKGFRLEAAIYLFSIWLLWLLSLVYFRPNH